MIQIDIDRYTVLASGKPVALTPKQFKVLRQLSEADGKVLSRKTLASGWGGKPTDSRTVDQHIARMRKALGEDGKLVKTVTGVGYKLEGAGTNARAVGKVLRIERECTKTGVVSTVMLQFKSQLTHISKGSAVSL